MIIKRLFLLFLLINSLFVYPTFAEDIKKSPVFPQDPLGFQGIKWGTPLSQLSNMVKIDMTGRKEIGECYIKRDENLNYKGVEFESIHYFFWQDKLYKIEAVTKNFSNAEKLRDLFISKYGARREILTIPGGPLFVYEWGWTDTDLSLSCEHNQQPYSGRGTLFMMSKFIYYDIEQFYSKKVQRNERR